MPWFQENDAESIVLESPDNTTTVDKKVTITSIPTPQQQSAPQVQVEEEGEEGEEKKGPLESDSGFGVDQQTINNQSPSSFTSSNGGGGIHLEVAESVHIQSQSQSPGSLSDLELIIPANKKSKTSAEMSTTATSECLGDDTSSFT